MDTQIDTAIIILSASSSPHTYGAAGLSQLVRHGMSAGIQPALKVLRMHNNKLTGETDRLL